MSKRRNPVLYTVVMLVLALLAILLSKPSSPSSRSSTSGSTGGSSSSSVSNNGGSAPSAGGTLGNRTKFSGCVSQNALPDPDCTPGAILADATKDKICVPGYSSQTRNVTTAEKDQVYAEYGIATHTAGQYEVDHLISLELGGSNDISNLWPEPAEPRPGFHEKDKVENYLHQQVCDGAITLADAQYQIAHDWMSVYQTMPGQ